MKKISLTVVSVIIMLAILSPATALASSPIVNGSFETGDGGYDGWILWEGPLHYPGRGTWGIAGDGEVIIPGQQTYDYHDGILVTQNSPGLPITYQTTDGDYLAYQLQNGPQDHRMYQDVALSESATTLSWDMFYTNHNPGGFDDDDHYLAVHIRRPDDNILATAFKTEPGDPQSILMQNFTFDISPYAGTTVRIDVEIVARQHFIDAGFDNFVIEQIDQRAPPGWDKGKKTGWDGSVPPGLEKKDKTPGGFDKGDKSGWE